MNPLKTVGGKLAGSLLLVVAAALAIVYLIVVPSYKRSLVDSRLTDLSKAATTLVTSPSTPPFLSQNWVETEAAPVAESFNARVVVFHVKKGGLERTADSKRDRSRGLTSDPTALRAVAAHTVERGVVTRLGEEFAEAAAPVRFGGTSVILLASPLHNDLESVAVVRKRFLIAGALATLFAISTGYGLAVLFARRIRHLEAAAERIASGSFGETVDDTASDELGQLARAFDRMRRRLASLDRARAEFIANASHELRTPLFSLGGFLELLQGEDLDAETRAEFVGAMREQVSRLGRLATDLLDLSRLDAGRLTVVSEPVELAVVGDVLATEFGPSAATSEHELEVALEPEAVARADEERVLRIGRILVENALVHTPPGSTVRISAEADANVATLAVTDDGSGIPPDGREQIFQRFYRLDGTLASGSGLGLAIARELAELMGGRIAVESGDGVTRFALVLPREASDRSPATLTA